MFSCNRFDPTSLKNVTGAKRCGNAFPHEKKVWERRSLSTMGGGTFFKVGGHKRTLKKIIANFLVWIGNCDVTSIEIWRHYIRTTWRSKLHYFRQNYTTV